MKKIVKESIGRDLVGASAYSSRSKVVHNILLKYPTPDKLSGALAQMAKDTTNQKVAKKCLELSEKCKTTDIQQYPGLVKDITGLSKFWSLAAKTIGIATAAAGTTYLVRSALQAADDPSVKNATNFGDKAKALMSKTGDVIGQDYQNVKNNIGAFKDNVVQKIRDWSGDQLSKSAAGQKTQSDIAANKAATEKNAEGVAANKAVGEKNSAAISKETSDRIAANTEQQKALDAEIAIRKNGQEALQKGLDANAAADAARNAALKSGLDKETADRIAADVAQGKAIRDEMGKGFSSASAARSALKDEIDQNVHEINRNRSDIDQHRADIDTNAEAISTGLEKAASDRQAIRDWGAKQVADAEAARSALQKGLDAETASRISGDKDLGNRLQKSHIQNMRRMNNIDNRIDDNLSIGGKVLNSLGDGDTWKDAYSPYVDATKDAAKKALNKGSETANRIRNWWNNIPVSNTGYHGMY